MCNVRSEVPLRRRSLVLPVIASLVAAAAGAEPPASRRPVAKPTPAPPPVLEGVVRGPGTKPLEKALVIAMTSAGRPGDVPVVTRTDAEGRFRLALRSAAKHHVRAESNGLAGRTIPDVVPGAPLTIDLAPGGSIEGIVRDGSTGQPAVGIRVETREPLAIALGNDPDAGPVRATTDSEGRFRLAGLATGRHEVSARARGRGFASRNAVPLGARVELTLEPAATLLGTVRGPDGKPVAGAVVTPLAIQSARATRPEQ